MLFAAHSPTCLLVHEHLQEMLSGLMSVEGLQEGIYPLRISLTQKPVEHLLGFYQVVRFALNGLDVIHGQGTLGEEIVNMITG